RPVRPGIQHPIEIIRADGVCGTFAFLPVEGRDVVGGRAAAQAVPDVAVVVVTVAEQHHLRQFSRRTARTPTIHRPPQEVADGDGRHAATRPFAVDVLHTDHGGVPWAL